MVDYIGHLASPLHYIAVGIFNLFGTKQMNNETISIPVPFKRLIPLIKIDRCAPMDFTLPVVFLFHCLMKNVTHLESSEQDAPRHATVPMQTLHYLLYFYFIV